MLEESVWEEWMLVAETQVDMKCICRQPSSCGASIEGSGSTHRQVTDGLCRCRWGACLALGISAGRLASRLI